MSVRELQSLNGLSGTNIKVGQKLAVYETKRAAPAPTTRKVTHVVSSGEVLGTIAEKYGVRVSDVQRWNGLKGSNIRVGQKLTIHSKASAKAAPRTHKVQSGESLWSIAQKHGVTVAQLQRWNDLAGSTLRPGQKLTIKR